MQEIPTNNKNQRLENKGKHIGGVLGKVKHKSFMDEPIPLDKHGMSISDYR